MLIKDKEDIVKVLINKLPMNDVFQLDSAYFKILLQSFNPKSVKTTFDVNFAATTYSIPSEALGQGSKDVVRVERWNVDLLGGKRLLSPTVTLSIYDDGAQLAVKDLKTPIGFTIPKMAPTPVSATNSRKFQCAYFDSNTQNFVAEGCSFVKENVTHIFCQCTHMTDYASKVDEASPPITVKMDDIKGATLSNFNSLVPSEVKNVKSADLFSGLTNDASANGNGGSGQDWKGIWCAVVAFVVFLAIMAIILAIDFIRSLKVTKTMTKDPEAQNKVKEAPPIWYSAHPILSLIFFDRAGSYGKLTRVNLLFTSVFAILGGNAICAQGFGNSDIAYFCFSVAISVMIACIQNHTVIWVVNRLRLRGEHTSRGSPWITNSTALIIIIVWAIVTAWRLTGLEENLMNSWIKAMIVALAIDLIILDSFMILLAKYVQKDLIQRFIALRGFMAKEMERMTSLQVIMQTKKAKSPAKGKKQMVVVPPEGSEERSQTGSPMVPNKI
eukprot:TRINITY_DN8059_c0_g1_i2.p1 TRINITY_DN8059_c0_g1~~TRINITY_DN8059_c0_g1_i2.p1  ORF type:complete len:498 (-),score=122.08 TRINITY_DN8059_c0_g1_i2:151-1644(-)